MSYSEKLKDKFNKKETLVALISFNEAEWMDFLTNFSKLKRHDRFFLFEDPAFSNASHLASLILSLPYDIKRKVETTLSNLLSISINKDQQTVKFILDLSKSLRWGLTDQALKDAYLVVNDEYLKFNLINMLALLGSGENESFWNQLEYDVYPEYKVCRFRKELNFSTKKAWTRFNQVELDKITSEQVIEVLEDACYELLSKPLSNSELNYLFYALDSDKMDYLIAFSQESGFEALCEVFSKLRKYDENIEKSTHSIYYKGSYVLRKSDKKNLMEDISPEFNQIFS